MIRSTTPKHGFIIQDGVLDSAEEIIVSYKQGRIARTVIWAGANTEAISVHKDDNLVEVAWSQEESARFRHDRDLRMQVKVFDSYGDVGASKPVDIRVSEILDDSIMGGNLISTTKWKWIYDDFSKEESSELYDSLSIEHDNPDDWDYSISPEEVSTLCAALDIENDNSGFDMELNSREAGKLCSKLRMTNY